MSGPGRPLWSVLTVTYNSAGVLGECWRGAADRSYEWIVVDNASADGSAALAERLDASVIRLDRNVGFATANNLAVRHATGRYLLFANPDLVLDPTGLPALRAHLDRHGGLAAPQLLFASGEPQPNGRGLPYLTARLGNRRVWPFSRLHAAYRVLARPGEARWVSWATGAALAVRRSDWAAIGGWDERFFLYYEDIELCLRAWRQGQPVSVLGDVRWVHRWGRATNTLRWSQAHNLELRAASRFYATHPEFVLGLPRPRRRHGLAARFTGSAVAAADIPGPRLAPERTVPVSPADPAG